LRAWLIRLKAFLEAKNFALADILAPQFSTQTVEAPVAEVRAQIRKAYLDITGGRLNARVLLSDLRRRLKDLDRATLDSALRHMHLEEGTTLSGLNNPQEITPEIRDAGLDF